jgi:hypothetical protein
MHEVSHMLMRGRVENGVVVLDETIRLPEGLEVTVVTPQSPAHAGEPGTHSFLDIPPVSVGAVLRPLTSDDDLLGEMLEDDR